LKNGDGSFACFTRTAGCSPSAFTYLEFLGQRLSPKSENERAAHFKERAEYGSDSTPRTQAEMQRLLEGDEAASSQRATQQIDFGL
jgi:hypothetical protein